MTTATLPLMPLVLLAACAVPGPAPKQVGSVSLLGQTYPVEEAAPGRWWVRVDGQIVRCSAPDLEACRWSVRHHLDALSLLDDLG
ncbi:hypothetical protein [Albidovulum sp.]